MASIREQRDWHRQDVRDVLRTLGTPVDAGLRNSDATAKLAIVGPNQIESERPPSFLQLLAHQLADFMIGLLIAAAVISGLLGDFVDTVAIVVIVIVNAGVGVFQEYRAQRAVAALREMAAPLARVLRDGAVDEIPAHNLVPGDIALLEAGDVVPADLRLLETSDLGIDESALTGESVPVAKHERTLDSLDVQLGDMANMAFKSTLVTRGRGRGVVVATGGASEIGRIAELLRGDRTTRTPLQTRLALFSRRIALLVLGICAIVFATGLLQGQPVLLMFLTALSLAVAAVPEALPAVITVALGLGAKRLSELNALVRRLPAVESLGSVTYICTDKTGTLTENRMSVGAIVIDGERYEGLTNDIPQAQRDQLGRVLALCNDVTRGGGRVKGDPTEVALMEFARLAGYDKFEMEQVMPRIGELPFAAERGFMATLHELDGSRLALVKGAPERIVAGCVDQTVGDRRVALSENNLAIAELLAEEGYRVLALAAHVAGNIDPTGLEKHWSFLGFVGLIDPPRAGVREAIDECRAAGIVPVMITGDHPATARAIAAKIGLIGNSDDTLTGVQLAELGDEQLADRVERIRIYSRVNPEQKIRIVSALQAKGHFVAMTGDGVNDAPALKQATIGVAMGERGTEVAREAAEIVLLDDSFPTIVAAVREGRRIFDDIRKFIRYTMTSNSGEIWVLVLAPLLGMPLPLLPLHILWINLVTDGFPGLALSAEPAERDVMTRPPRPPEQGIFTADMLTQILWIGLTIGGLTLATQAWALGSDTANWQTMVFTVLVVAQLCNSLAIRSERDSLLSIGLFTNPALLAAVSATLIAQLAIIYVPALNTVFHTAPLTIAEFGFCMAAGLVVLVLIEIEKRFKYSRQTP